jgi:nucleoid DNA-binding protein
MKQSVLVEHLEKRTALSSQDIRRILVAMSEVVANELQCGEEVHLPRLGKVVPMEKKGRGNRTVKVVTFEPSTLLRKRLAVPIKRLRAVDTRG